VVAVYVGVEEVPLPVMVGANLYEPTFVKETTMAFKFRGVSVVVTVIVVAEATAPLATVAHIRMAPPTIANCE